MVTLSLSIFEAGRESEEIHPPGRCKWAKGFGDAMPEDMPVVHELAYLGDRRGLHEL